MTTMQFPLTEKNKHWKTDSGTGCSMLVIKILVGGSSSN